MTDKPTESKAVKFRVEILPRRVHSDSDHQCFAFLFDLLVDPRSGQPELHELPPDYNKRNGR